jgi:hypothetical protein
MLATLPRSKKRTHAKILASGRRVLGGAQEKDEAFKGVSEFSRIWYHNIAKHTKYDLAHALANQVKDTIRYMMVHTRLLISPFQYLYAAFQYLYATDTTHSPSEQLGGVAVHPSATHV